MTNVRKRRHPLLHHQGAPPVKLLLGRRLVGHRTDRELKEVAYKHS